LGFFSAPPSNKLSMLIAAFAAAVPAPAVDEDEEDEDDDEDEELFAWTLLSAVRPASCMARRSSSTVSVNSWHLPHFSCLQCGVWQKWLYFSLEISYNTILTSFNIKAPVGNEKDLSANVTNISSTGAGHLVASFSLEKPASGTESAQHLDTNKNTRLHKSNVLGFTLLAFSQPGFRHGFFH
jgi:hypothetical protein